MQANGRTIRTTAAGAGVIAACLLLTLGAASFFLRVFRPVRHISIPAAYQGYDSKVMLDAVQPSLVRKRLDTITDFGPRLLGRPGVYRTAAYIRKAFEDAGLEVIEHEVQTAAPHTAFREMYRVAGDGGPDELLGDVDVYPFMSNHMQPVVTPDTGLVGTLVLLDRATLRTRERFDDCIGVIDSREGMVDPDMAYSWVRYARLGIKAIIVSHSQGIEQAPWHIIAARFSGIVCDAPVNYVRVAATSGVFSHIGETVRLRVRVDFKPTRDITLYGILRAPQPSSEALIVYAGYDAATMLPDLSVSPLQAIRTALQLQIVQGLGAYRTSIRRDIVFMASSSTMMAEEGVNHLIRILGDNNRSTESNRLTSALGIAGKEREVGRRQKDVEADSAANAGQIAMVETVAGLLGDERFLVDPDATSGALRTLSKPQRRFLGEQFSYVMNSIVMEVSEPKLQAKIAFERNPSVGTGSEVFLTYLNAKRVYDAVSSAASYGPANLLRRKADVASTHRVRERFAVRISELLLFHTDERNRLVQEGRLARLFDSYTNIAAFELRPVATIVPEEQREVFTLDASNRIHEPALPTIANVVTGAWQRLGLGREVDIVLPSEEQVSALGANTDLWVAGFISMWNTYGYPAYAFTNLGRTQTFRRMGTPIVHPAMSNVESLRATFALTGESIASLAHGNGLFQPVLIEEHRNKDWGGQVLAANIGQSIVPNFPLANALVSGRPYETKAMYGFPGIYPNPMIFADPYGKYMRKRCASDFPVWWRVNVLQGYNPIAVQFGDDGLISYMKDEGEDGQRLFKSVNVDVGSSANVTVVTFRASPITILDLTNPQTMKDYTSVDMLERSGLTRAKKRCLFEEAGLQMMYLEPDQRFFVSLQSGAPNNELVKTTRAFMLGIDDPATFTSDKEIDGPGYLAADHYYLLNVPQNVARSMAWVNGKRLDLQNRFAMADDQTNEYHAKMEERLAESQAGNVSHHEQTLYARDAVTYAELNHPVLRESIMEAVLGILWYLGLLVPFVFFFEKLLFCNTDVRKQIAWQAIIFIVVFALLRLLHPAFHMVRSSLMILLGFVIILISGGITILFSGKFQENLEELRKKQGKVAAADVNKMGVIMSAFMLGLNNMNRRKMRTGLTSATLTLLTFVMICFTSVQNNVVDENVAVGKAAFQGLFLKRERMLPISEGEVLSLRSKYGSTYSVSHRRVLIGKEDWSSRKRKNPELNAVYAIGGLNRTYKLGSAILMNHNDPLVGQIEFTTQRGWFTPEEDRESPEVCPIFIPGRMADDLGITAQSVDSDSVFVTIAGTRFFVKGIFNARTVRDLRDIDGRDILPFDLESMAEVVQLEGSFSADDGDPRIDPERLILTPVRTMFRNVPNASERIVSACVSMQGAAYRDARKDIESYLEQTGQRMYYGLDGVAYRGRRTRATSMAGLIDLLIPLLIAAMTVLNTMKGSVYERRDEIFVYNAVGIAPRYVFFMFIAEAFVYAVVGSVLGYLLSQGTGRVLTMLNLTGGLNMTFASLSTIYASLTIAGAVFISTYFPARSAMAIAAPAEESGWTLPEPDEDNLEFDLPFNFSTRDRIAVLAFFERYLQDNGEGSSGRFFAGSPHVGVLPDAEEGEAAGYIPLIGATIWLKPFDLAVCQQLTISMPPDPETGQYKARILLERLSGTRESWLRLNQSFVALMRRHFLHWRAVSEPEREEMFCEAREDLRKAYNIQIKNETAA